jgi:uncharacterized membrane protein
LHWSKRQAALGPGSKETDMLRKSLVLASAVIMAACSPTEPSPGEASPAGSSSAGTPAVESPAPESPLAGDLRILGTEPFWSIDISKTTNSATYSRAGEADAALGYPNESQGADGAIVLTSTSSQGNAVMTLRSKDCSDGMSDRTYPWDAEVAFKGETLKGCAATPEFLRQTPQ